MPSGNEDAHEPVSVDLLITNAAIYRFDGSLTTGNLACSGGLITRLDSVDGPTTDYSALQTIDARGGLVHPGLTDAHFHAPLFATRNLLDTRGPRDEYFRKYVQWFNHVDDEIEYLSTVAACIEALANGVTGFIEPGTAMEPDAVASAATEVGVRCSVGDSFVWDRGDFWMATEISRRPLAGSSPNLGTQLWRNDEAHRGSLISGHVAVYGSASASASLLRDAFDCAKERGSFLTLHQSPTPENAGLDERYFGRPAVMYMEDQGLLADEILLAHMNALSQEEEVALGRSNATVAWCPANTINWGMAPTSCLPRLIATGSRVALGSDLPKTWALSDQISLAILQARSVGVDLEPSRLYDAVFAQVRRLTGRSAFVPGVEIGAPADLVIRKSATPEDHPGLNLLGHLAVAKSRSVDKVIVNGRLAYDNGSPNVDEEAAIQKLALKAREIVDRI